MVFQQDALFPWRTVAGNIGFGIQSSAGSDADRIVRDLIAEVGLGGFESHYPATLSGGMRQRAALARTLAPDPSTLLLDEPFGALDQITRQQMQELLAEICWNRAKTVVLVTHDVAEAIFLADRVLVMSARPGRIVDDISVDLLSLPGPTRPEPRIVSSLLRLGSWKRPLRHDGIGLTPSSPTAPPFQRCIPCRGFGSFA